MAHASGEIKMTAHYVVAMFALMSSCLATAGKLHVYYILLNIFFLSLFSLGKFRACDIYVKLKNLCSSGK